MDYFPRNEYYSQTEAARLFKVSAKRYKELLDQHQVPVVSRTVNIGTYTIQTMYVKKEDFQKLFYDNT